ncbi:MAG TPA: T9SS type A sorting domain-containing protein, partial [Flavilitoribacter sp.]|nr:T9SS type A sorting domain-containing protein [Flavilitoribacter sp.]
YDDRNEEIGVAMAFNRTDAAAAGLRLLPNRPNPFNDFTVIGFTLPEEGQATLRVLDLNGREIQSWKGVYPKGYSEETFRAGDRLPEGIYIYAIETEWGAISLRMVLAKK